MGEPLSRARMFRKRRGLAVHSRTNAKPIQSAQKAVNRDWRPKRASSPPKTLSSRKRRLGKEKRRGLAQSLRSVRQWVHRCPCALSTGCLGAGFRRKTPFSFFLDTLMTFTLARRVSIDSKGTEFQEYIDDRLGAKHIHVKADTTEMAFMAALPTLPEDDKGAAHILEHMALCGSERFPVRDPFFGMTRRSLSSFMNAMTSADHTVYPFATQDAKDFENLLDVYLDAVFFPTLARHDFLQEGWRHETKDSALQLHGVVLNEMKGDFSNPVRAAYMGLQSALRPGTTYAVESGGDPLAIPFLTHEELIEFHQAHYHPSRATFYTYGAVDAEAFQATLEARVLSRFAQRLERFSAQMAPSLTSVVSVEIEKPQGADEAEHGFAVAWSVGDRGRDDDAIDEWEFFFAALNADGSSPLARALETAGFGRPG